MQTKLEILKAINPKDFFPDAKHIITYAFTIGERHYFRFDDPLNTPYDRALKTLVYYKELDMNCDRVFLKAHTEAFDNALKQTSITIDTLVELKQLNDQLKARLELPKENELMYKLASVVFFDQHESPYTYEFKYGINKIKAWKKEVSLTDFFLSMPLRTLIPYLDFAKENLSMFSQMTDKATSQHLEKISEMLSEEQKQILKNRFTLSPTI
jgi:hypothetical protein